MPMLYSKKKPSHQSPAFLNEGTNCRKYQTLNEASWKTSRQDTRWKFLKPPYWMRVIGFAFGRVAAPANILLSPEKYTLSETHKLNFFAFAPQKSAEWAVRESKRLRLVLIWSIQKHWDESTVLRLLCAYFLGFSLFNWFVAVYSY